MVGKEGEKDFSVKVWESSVNLIFCVAWTRIVILASLKEECVRGIPKLRARGKTLEDFVTVTPVARQDAPRQFDRYQTQEIVAVRLAAQNVRVARNVRGSIGY